MARIPLREPRGLDLLRRLAFRSARKMYGSSLEPNGVIAYHKPLMLGVGMAGVALERYGKSVPQRHKSLAMLRTAQLIGCEWCLDFGSKHALDGGVAEDDLRELSLWRTSPRFDELDRLVLEYAEAVTRTPVQVSDELFAALHEHYDETQMVELTLAITLENLFSRSNWAFGVGSQGFSEGSYCVMPDTARTAAGVSLHSGDFPIEHSGATR